ncbi:hypothetical protein J6590_068720 [Homalodisca vitripennis]|nr:hypothetical protein J6590_068720 [Homalodisca vitripennis]
MALAKDLINTVRESTVGFFRSICCESANDQAGLQSLCPTRWTIRASSILGKFKNFEELLQMFEIFSAEDKTEANVKANLTTTNSEKTLRQHLQLILPNVRLLTFSPEDFSKEVIWTKILKSDEVVELLSAIANKHTLDLPGFCSSYKLREQPDHKSIYLSRRDICKMKFDLCTSIRGPNMALSSVIIYTTEDILIESFGVRSKNISDKLAWSTCWTTSPTTTARVDH